MNVANPTLSNGHRTMSSQPWLKETLRSFFEGVAWTGQTPSPARGSSAHNAGACDSMMTMPVNRFFDTIAWDGQPAIGVPIAPMEAQPEIQSEGDSLTLDGFSDLFG